MPGNGDGIAGSSELGKTSPILPGYPSRSRTPSPLQARSSLIRSISLRGFSAASKEVPDFRLTEQNPYRGGTKATYSHKRKNNQYIRNFINTFQEKRHAEEVDGDQDDQVARHQPDGKPPGPWSPLRPMPQARDELKGTKGEAEGHANSEVNSTIKGILPKPQPRRSTWQPSQAI